MAFGSISFGLPAHLLRSNTPAKYFKTELYSFHLQYQKLSFLGHKLYPDPYPGVTSPIDSSCHPLENSVMNFLIKFCYCTQCKTHFHNSYGHAPHGFLNFMSTKSQVFQRFKSKLNLNVRFLSNKSFLTALIFH